VTGGLQKVFLAPGFPVEAGDLIGISVVRADCGAPYLNAENPAFRTAIFDQTIHSDVSLCDAFDVRLSLELEASGGADDVYAGTIPGAGSAAGQSGGNFKTSVQLTNAGIFPIAGRLFFHPISQGADSALSYALDSFQTVSYPDIVEAMSTTGLGSIDLFTSSGYAPLVSTRVFNDQGVAGTAGFSEPFVQPDDDFLLSGDARDTGVLVGPEDVARFRYNFGVRAFASGASMEILVFNPDGQGILHVTRTFAPDQFVQLSAKDFLRGTDITANQSFRIDITAGSALVYGVTIDNTTNDTAFRLASRRRR